MNGDAIIGEPQSRNVRVFVIEDDPADARLLREVLRDATGFQFVLEIAGTLSAGLERLEAGGIDVLLLDLTLPDSKGMATFEKVYEKIPAVPVIVLTIVDDESLALSAVRKGAQDYLVKGRVDSNLLVRSIRYAIERKRFEGALQEQLQFLQILIDTIASPIFYKDTQGVYQGCNRAFGDYLGLSKEAIVGKTVYDLFPKELADIYYKKDVDLLRDPGTQVYESVVRDDGGTVHPVIFSKATYCDTQGVVKGLVGVMVDIGERKRVEEALSAEKKRLDVTLRSIADGVITADNEGRVMLMSRAAEDMTGWTQEEAIGRPVNTVFRIFDKSMRKEQKDFLTRASASVTIETGADAIMVARDGSQKPVAHSGAPIQDEEDRTIGVVIVFRDLTIQQKMEEELQKSSRLESIGVLAGGIAHDFNNILTGIMGNIAVAKLFLDQKGKAFERLQRAEEASLRAKDLTQQLLTFAMGGEPVQRVVSVAKLVEDAAAFATRGSNVLCEFFLPDDLWAAEVDPGQMSQVFNNLVMNAREAMPNGGIVEVFAENLALGPQMGEQALPLSPGKYVKISVRDRGFGIAEEDLSKVFDPYFTTKAGGRGLGLATCYSIVKKHRGHIALESEPGAGTAVHVYLPACEEEVAAVEAVQSCPLDSVGRILIMDDEEIVRDVARAMLEQIGYAVEVAPDGAKAIDRYIGAWNAGTRFDAVIMDLTIPGGMGGKEAAIRLLEVDPDARIIVSSGYSDDPIMSNFGEHGFRDVIVKPYQLEELREVMHRVLTGA